MLELFAEGFEELDSADAVELAGYALPGQAADVRSALAGHGLATISTVEPGWDTAWHRFHRPVVIDGLWLGPPWETAPAGLQAVTIKPGMAFGTGAHPTTRLCIELLLHQPRSALLDLGCGSGVLSVVGAVAGFAPVTAVDSDSVATEETRENAARNDVWVDVLRADARRLERCRPALVTANLPLAALLECITTIQPLRAVVSGFALAALPGYQVAEQTDCEGWAAAVLVRHSDQASADNYP